MSQHVEHSLFLCVGEPPLVVCLELGVPGDEAEFEVQMPTQSILPWQPLMQLLTRKFLSPILALKI